MAVHTSYARDGHMRRERREWCGETGLGGEPVIMMGGAGTWRRGERWPGG